MFKLKPGDRIAVTNNVRLKARPLSGGETFANLCHVACAHVRVGKLEAAKLALAMAKHMLDTNDRGALHIKTLYDYAARVVESAS